jgi:hypothetical protein
MKNLAWPGLVLFLVNIKNCKKQQNCCPLQFPTLLFKILVTFEKKRKNVFIEDFCFCRNVSSDEEKRSRSIELSLLKVHSFSSNIILSVFTDKEKKARQSKKKDFIPVIPIGCSERPGFANVLYQQLSYYTITNMLQLSIYTSMNTFSDLKL